VVRKMCALIFTFRAKPVHLPRQRSGDVRGDDSENPVASDTPADPADAAAQE
jgi:hypothetical protein